MISLSVVTIFLMVGICLTRVTAGTPVVVTPVDGTHISIEMRTEWDVCKSIRGETILMYQKKSNPSFDFSYDPLVYIKKHLTACLKDGNLEIYADAENALKSCFSKGSIQMFCILSGKELPLKLGSNNITQENLKDKKNLHVKIRQDKTKEFTEYSLNITESCATQSKSESENTSFVIGIVFGLIGLVVVVVVICFFVIRSRRVKKTEETVKDEKESYYGNEEYTYYDRIKSTSYI